MKMRALSGYLIDLDLPFGDDEADRVLLDDAAHSIVYEWEIRLQDPSARRRDRNAWLEDICYRVIQHILDNDIIEILHQRCEHYDRYRTGGQEGLNPFQIGVMALFAHRLGMLNARDRERIGKRLWHAYRHYVPAPFLRGFLYQVGGSHLLTFAGGDGIEDELIDWVVQQRLAWRDDDENEATDHRGPYPTRVLQAISERRADTRGLIDQDDDGDDFNDPNADDDD